MYLPKWRTVPHDSLSCIYVGETIESFQYLFKQSQHRINITLLSTVFLADLFRSYDDMLIIVYKCRLLCIRFECICMMDVVHGHAYVL